MEAVKKKQGGPDSSKSKDMLLKGANEFRFWFNFSILRTFPKLCYHKTDSEVISRKNPLIQSSQEQQALESQIIIEEELQAIKGINVISYLMLVMLFGILLNMDMVTSNTWTTF